MQAVELPSAYDIATRGTFPASYAGRPSSYSSHSRTNRTRSSTSSNMYATARKGSAPGASRGSPRASPQKRAATNSAAVKKPSEEQGARSSLQPTARSSNKSSTTASSTTTAQQPGAGGHSYPKSPRHNSNSSSKSHNHQQQQGTRRSSESLPPRLRNSVEHNMHSSKKHHQHQHKKTSTSSSSNTSSSQAKGSKDSSVQPSSSSSSSSADPPNPAPSAPPTISVTLTQAQSDEVEAGEKNSVNDENTTVHVTSRSKLHKNMRSSADSGHCEDFNSSCESDSPSSLPTTDHQQQEEMELVSMVISSGVESDHGASDACDDDVFVDALSNIPSENSSAYVTPYSTRSQSPAPQEISEISENGSSTLPSLSSSAKDPSSALNSQDSIERVRVSLQKVLDLRLASAGSSSSSSTTVELDDATSPTSDLEAAVVDRNLESCDSQVTILGSSTKGEGSSTKSTPCSITFIHPSSVFDIDDEDKNSQSSTNHSPAEFRTTTCRPRCLSKDISNIFIGEMELDVSSDADDDSAVDFMSRSRSPSFPLGEEDNDSGCATSIGSPDKITSSLDFKRPGLIHMPVELLLQMEEESNKNGERAGSRGDGVFSQGESSGLNLELSNSDEAQDENQRTQIEGEGRDSDSDGGKDEWPDLFSGENSVPPHSAPGSSYDNNTSTTSMFDYPGASLSMPPPPPPSMNGFVHPPFPFMPPMPPSSTSNNNGSKSDSDPSQIMASINSHVRQQQQAVYQQHQLMFSNGGYPPMGPPPPPPPPHHVHGQMFPPAGPRGGPTGFMGFFPPPPPFSLGPGFPPLPPHPPMGGDFLLHPPPPLLPPTTLAPPIQPPPQPRPPSSQLSAENTNEDDTQDSSLSQQSSPQSTPASFSPPPSPALCEKHQLCSTWVMWYDKITGSGRGQMCDYKNSLKNLSTIDSIENFWGTYNNIVPPSGLDKCANYHFFKEGIFPLWEDEANKQGGKWVLTIKDDPGLLDQAWMEVLLMLIGGGMEQFDNVNGVVVSRRKKGDRISLWTKKRTKKASLKVCVELVQSLCVAFEVVGEEAKQFVQELAENQHGISLAYLYHSDSLKSGNSYSNEQHIKLKDHLDAILQDLNL